MKRFFNLVFIGWLLSSSSAIAADKFTLILDWFPNPNHAPLFVAIQQGFFKDQGLDIELISPADPNDPPKLIAAKQADLALSYQPQLLLQVQQGLPLVRVATLINSPLNCIAVPAQGPIQQVADLKGKRIGYSSDIDNALLASMLKQHHLSLADVILINVHFNLTQALLSKKVDAIIGIMRNFEPLQLAQQNYPVQLFQPEKNGIPPYDELIFIANRNQVADPRLPRFIKALTLGVQYLKQHPEQSWQTFAKIHPESDNELNRQAWFATVSYFAQNPATLDSKRYQNFALFLKEQGLIREVPALKEYAIGIETR